MTTLDLVKKYLPQDLWDTAMGYSIPDEFLQDVPDLIEMILRSRSIDTHDEKQNRFNLLPLMNTTQLEKLRAILVKEKTKLAEIEQKYEEKKLEIKKKYLMKRQEMWYVKQVEEVQQQEAQHSAKDQEEADQLLSSL